MHRLAIVLVLAATACSDDVDLTGIYRVDLSVGSEPCGEDVPNTETRAFIKFEKKEFIGEYFEFSECSDEAGTDCESSGGLFGGLHEPIDNGWRGTATFSSFSGTQCFLGMATTTATLEGTALVIDSFEYGEIVTLPDAECQPEEAERRGTDMPCEEHARIEATRL